MNIELTKSLMLEFAKATGVDSDAPARRYLWTDAYAVCNFLGLYRQSGQRHYLNLAIRLVDQVHHVLGRHRNDDLRHGWISGLSDQEGELHPTCGGLRIGKSLNERPEAQPVDPREEWDRDGQYFHYLTKWMHALNCIGRETGDVRYQHWATELAVIAQKSFTRESYPGGPKRMVWKMSIDLSRPLVPSMGQHDPLDGLVTCLELQSNDNLRAIEDDGLNSAIRELTDMSARGNWVTEDLLGIGGLMDDASRLAQIVFHRDIERRGTLRQILNDALTSIGLIDRWSILHESAGRRLPFREIGFAIGLHELECVKEVVSQDLELAVIVRSILTHRPLAERIQQFWCNPDHWRGDTWVEHRDINSVMLATCLVPQEFLQS